MDTHLFSTLTPSGCPKLRLSKEPVIMPSHLDSRDWN